MSITTCSTANSLKSLPERLFRSPMQFEWKGIRNDADCLLAPGGHNPLLVDLAAGRFALRRCRQSPGPQASRRECHLGQLDKIYRPGGPRLFPERSKGQISTRATVWRRHVRVRRVDRSAQPPVPDAGAIIDGIF